MIHFLRYSLHHGKRIKVMLLIDEKIAQENILVTALSQTHFSYITARRKLEVTLPMEALLCAGYARGDHGENDMAKEND